MNLIIRKHNILLYPSYPAKKPCINRKENKWRQTMRKLQLLVNSFHLLSGRMNTAVYITSTFIQQCCWLSILFSFLLLQRSVIPFIHCLALLHYHTTTSLLASALQIKCIQYLVNDPSTPAAYARVSIFTSISSIQHMHYFSLLASSSEWLCFVAWPQRHLLIIRKKN